ncbi:hypothetical protein [uncultured Psychrobacter sp.]
MVAIIMMISIIMSNQLPSV